MKLQQVQGGAEAVERQPRGQDWPDLPDQHDRSQQGPLLQDPPGGRARVQDVQHGRGQKTDHVQHAGPRKKVHLLLSGNFTIAMGAGIRSGKKLLCYLWVFNYSYEIKIDWDFGAFVWQLNCQISMFDLKFNVVYCVIADKQSNYSYKLYWFNEIKTLKLDAEI